ncbi:hypothetical protein [Pseudomonas sp. BIC9C]|uniref:hypothetical protein n=1 Tax=Pseudomonas sp. BIC9C TaxID=3078458 RepID=UPI002AD5AC2F|nr:hypothetical protein [Pseudomonas sp. BIC9C]
MSIGTNELVKILDEAVTNGMDVAIQKYGANLSNDEKAGLKSLTPEQTKDALLNLLAASKALGKPFWFDNNNNNH